MLVGLMGYARSGKNTVANVLVRKYGFTEMAFADALREMALGINPIVDFLPSGVYRYQNAISDYGYDEAKSQFPEVREFLQRLGTEGVRDVLGPDTWVDLVERRWHADGQPDLVITDVRFPNEYEMVRRNGGVLARVKRPEVQATNRHISESALDSHDSDFVFWNDGTIADLENKVDVLLKRFGYDLD